MEELSRRRFLATSVVAGTWAGYRPLFASEGTDSKRANVKSADPVETEVEVSADLMREHGVLRRILIVYGEAAGMLQTKAAVELSGPVHKAAQLLERFGVTYHEKALEEAIIFPAVSKSDTDAAGYPQILIAQHEQGRLITQFVLEETAKKEPDGPQLAQGDGGDGSYVPGACRTGGYGRFPGVEEDADRRTSRPDGRTVPKTLSMNISARAGLKKRSLKSPRLKMSLGEAICGCLPHITGDDGRSVQAVRLSGKRL